MGRTGPQNGPLSPTSSKYAGRADGIAARVPAIEATRVPPAGESPKGREVHHVALGVPGHGEPRVDAVFGAEEPLVCARVHHVVPHVRGGREEVRHLFARRCRVTVDDPCVRRATGGTSRRHEDLGLAVDEVGDGEGIPRASSPPQRRAAHHREPERDRRERVRHDDPEVVVEDDVAGGGQPLERGPGVCVLWQCGSCAGLGERAIDREPQIFVVDGHFDFIARATTGYRRAWLPIATSSSSNVRAGQHSPRAATPPPTFTTTSSRARC